MTINIGFMIRHRNGYGEPGGFAQVIDREGAQRACQEKLEGIPSARSVEAMSDDGKLVARMTRMFIGDTEMLCWSNEYASGLLVEEKSVGGIEGFMSSEHYYPLRDSRSDLIFEIRDALHMGDGSVTDEVRRVVAANDALRSELSDLRTKVTFIADRIDAAHDGVRNTQLEWFSAELRKVVR